MAYDNIIYEKQDNIAVITFNRPEAMNALNIQTRAEFTEAARDVDMYLLDRLSKYVPELILT
jgi:enoyl-CoA hydratase